MNKLTTLVKKKPAETVGILCVIGLVIAMLMPAYLSFQRPMILVEFDDGSMVELWIKETEAGWMTASWNILIGEDGTCRGRRFGRSAVSWVPLKNCNK